MRFPLHHHPSSHESRLTRSTRRVERYNALPIEAPSVTTEPATTSTTGLPPRSPTLSVRTIATAAALETKQQQQSSPARAPEPVLPSSPTTTSSIHTSLSQSQVLSGGSPVAQASGGGTPADVREGHLSGHEPRVFPGMVTRSQRKDRYVKPELLRAPLPPDYSRHTPNRKLTTDTVD